MATILNYIKFGDLKHGNLFLYTFEGPKTEGYFAKLKSKFQQGRRFWRL